MSKEIMAKVLMGFSLACLLLLQPSLQAQSNEFSIQLNSGLFSFGGESSTSSSFIIVSDVATESNYTNNPYGTKKSRPADSTHKYSELPVTILFLHSIPVTNCYELKQRL